jgi:hypothetical protein
MESYAAPFRALAASAGFFVRAREVRLLHVVAASDVREAAIKVVMAQEYHADNHSPFVRLDAGHTPHDGGWAARSRELAAQEETWLAALGKEGVATPPRRASLPAGEAPAAGSADPLIAFAEAVWRAASRRMPGVEGLVLVLAPIEVESPEAFRKDLKKLLATKWLAGVRMVVVDADTSTLEGLAEAQGAAAMRVNVGVDEALVRRELDARIEAAATAPEQSPGPAQVGAAWPPEAPPRPPPPPPAELAAQLAAAGVPAALANPGIARLRPLVLRGAAAMRRGDPHEAVRHHSEAVKLANEAGLGKEAAVMGLVLATYVTQAGEPERAHGIYNVVGLRAADEGWHDVAAQALMARGALLVVERRRPEAAAVYAQAGEIAARGEEATLAIESFRMAGQLRAETRDEQLAIQHWARAVELAGGMELPAAGHTTAPMAARALAEVIRKRGLRAQSQALLEQAERMERAAGATT